MVEALAAAGFEGADFVLGTRDNGWDSEAAAIILGYYAAAYPKAKPIAVTNLAYLAGGALEMVNLDALGLAIKEDASVTVIESTTSSEPSLYGAETSDSIEPKLTAIQHIEEAYSHIQALRALGVNI